MNNINESSLSRVWQHVQGDRPVALITAFRGEFTYDDNVVRNKELASTLRGLGYGFFFVDGAWIENEGTDQEKHVSEDSLFVIGNSGDDESFKENIISLGAKYNQDAVLIKTVDGIKLYDKTGDDFMQFSNLSAGKLGSVYTKMRNNKKSNTFMFESERDDSGWLSRMRTLAGIK